MLLLSTGVSPSETALARSTIPPDEEDLGTQSDGAYNMRIASRFARGLTARIDGKQRLREIHRARSHSPNPRDLPLGLQETYSSLNAADVTVRMFGERSSPALLQARSCSPVRLNATLQELGQTLVKEEKSNARKHPHWGAVPGTYGPFTRPHMTPASAESAV